MPQRRVAVTGGIGAGKSALARELGRAGCTVLDADESARRAVAPGTTAHANLRTLVPTCFDGDQLDRTALAAAMFGDAGLRKQVEDVIHPWVRADLAAQAQQADAEVVVVDIPLLAESRSRHAATAEFDYVVSVWAPTALRRERLRERGLTDADIAARMLAQASDDSRQAVSDVVVPNAGTLAQLQAHAVSLLEAFPTLLRRRT
ncbi:MAG: dephospho-CoA kinase [Actinomycetales bacterium]|nr:dephospho-CoA kinase [Actinomycetales bacterium]